MRIAVIQHPVQMDSAGGTDALLRSIGDAVAGGAGLIAMVRPDGVGPGDVEAVAGDTTVLSVSTSVSPAHESFEIEIPSLGRVGMLTGDASIDPHVLTRAATSGLDILVLSPGSESDLQAEAILELALDLSVSVASLVLVVENGGAAPGSPGHGGSAIVYLGQVMAEATSTDEVLSHDIRLPLTRPEPRGPLPEVAPILLQRLATHRGVRLDVPYPADLS